MIHHENFSELFEQSLTEVDLRQGALVKATVIEVKPDFIVVSAGLKSEAFISREEFRNEEIAVGDEIEVVLEMVENGFGETRLSREKAKRAQVWTKLERIMEKAEIILGTIVERV